MSILRVQLQLIFSQPFKQLSQTLTMVFSLFEFSNHVIHIHLNFFMHLVMEQSYHCPLISGPIFFLV